MTILKPSRFYHAAILVAVAMLPLAAKAAVRPCEDVLKEMRATKTSANLTPDNRSKVDALEAKAVERCNADDDKRADAFLQDAMTLMGK